MSQTIEEKPKGIFPAILVVIAAIIIGIFLYPNIGLQKGETVPGQPTELAGTPGNGQAELTWTAPSSGGFDITSYTVRYDSGKGASTVSTESSEASYTLTGLTNETTYTISVAAENSLGLGEYSTGVEVTPTEGAGVSVPDAPTDLAGTPADGQISLTWTAANDNGAAITNHKVSYTPAGGDETQVSTTSGKSNYIIEGLENGTTYTIKVLAVNSEGDGEYSSSIEVASGEEISEPGAPTDLSGTPGDGQVELAWTAPEDDGGSEITGYTVGYSKSGGSITTVDTGGVGTSYTLTGLTNGTEYVIVVYAVNSAGSSRQSSSISKTPTDGSGPTISSLVVTTTDTTATFNWGTSRAASSQVKYGLTSSIDSDGKQSTEINTSPLVTGHTLTLSGLKSCSVYKYKAVSKDASLNVGQSDSSTFATKGCPGSVAPDPDKSVASKITPASGGVLTTTDGGKNIEVEVPAGASSDDQVFIQTNILDKTTAQAALSLPAGKSKWLGSAAQINALTDATTPKSDAFNEPVEVTLEYTDDELNGTDENSLKIYRHDGTTWYELDNCSVNTVDNVVTCYTTRFSTFGIFGEESSGSISGNTPSSSSGGSKSTNTVEDDNTEEVVMDSEAENMEEVVSEETENDTEEVMEESSSKFTKNLWYGVRGSEVLLLQRILNSLGFTVSSSGPGSPGNETDFFGPLTKDAVRRLQESNREEILIPIGLFNGTGYFGVMTRNYLNSK